jgi:predicted RNA-binding Zn ribbon-like protein
MDSLELIRDFVNTADLERQEDELADAEGFQRWLVRHRLAERGRRASEPGAAEARAVREALRELLRANNAVAVDRDAATSALDRAARAAGLSIRFVDGAVAFVPSRTGGLGTLLAAVAASMSDGSWPRLKACRSDSCRWAFVDTARNRSRQWCDMAVCGNREKARTFRQRHA